MTDTGTLSDDEATYRDIATATRVFRFLWIGWAIFILLSFGINFFVPRSLDQALNSLVLVGIPYLMSIYLCRMSRVAGAIIGLFSIFVFVSMGWQVVSIFSRSPDERFGGMAVDQRAFMVSMAAFFAYAGYFSFWLGRAGVRLLTSNPRTRLRVAEVYTATWPLSFKSISSALGMPFSISQIKKRGVVVLLLFLSASAGFSVLTLSIYFVPVSVPQLVLAYSVRDAFEGAIELSFHMTAGFVKLGVIGFAAGTIFQWFAKKLARQSLRDVQSLDPRPPIIFLRSFSDDQVRLKAPDVPLLARLYAIGDRSDNLDVVLLEEGSDYGPVVALGNPNDPIPPYGAARGYFAHPDWKEGVKALIDTAQAIVLCIDDTEGVWWEVEYLMSTRHAVKTLVLLHPSVKDESTRRRIVARLSKLVDGQTAAVVEMPAFMGFFKHEGCLQAASSTALSRASYVIVLRWFLRTKLGPSA